MKFSYTWLQSYFDEKLPPPEKLAELFTFRFSEVEGIEKVGEDTIFDLKILPDRACYALSHRGVAREIAAFTGLNNKDPETKSPGKIRDLVSGRVDLKIEVKEFKLCPRYIGVLIENVAKGETPGWIKTRLASIGQRSINSVVDIANYLMYDVGQPLHAFDADKVEGTLTVRLAKKGEAMMTLDNREVNFDGTELLIADDKGPLGIAGIKGGKRAEVTGSTTRLILEAAQFDATLLRKTSTKIGIRTDASKRFENRVPVELSEETMLCFVELVQETQKGKANVVSYADVHQKNSVPVSLSVSKLFIQEKLGIKISAGEIEKIFGTISISYTEKSSLYELTIPPWRLDLTSPEDIVEEVGRMYGYENVSPELPPKVSQHQKPLKSFYSQERIKDFLRDGGFSEVITYSFRKNGVVEVLKSLASDKNFLRENLTDNMKEALEMNLTNAPLLERERIQMFEIGNVFTKTGEETHLCVGITQSKSYQGEKVNESIRQLRDALVAFLGAPLVTLCTIDDTGGIILLSGKPIGTINTTDGIMEMNLGLLFAVLPEPDAWDIRTNLASREYSPISLYPFIVRDVAVYVNPDDSFEEVRGIVHTLIENKKLSNLLIQPTKPFDEFVNQKLGKKSFAFKLVFQSFEKTLTDVEVNAEMEHLYAALKSREGWQIR